MEGARAEALFTALRGSHTDCSQLARAPLPVWTGPKSRKSTPETFRLGNSQATGRASPRLPQTINKCSHTVEPPSERMHSCRQRMAPKVTTPAHGSLGAGTQQDPHSVRPQCPTGLDSTPILATTLKLKACDAELGRRGPVQSSCVQAQRQTAHLWEKPHLCFQSIHALFWNNDSLALGYKGRPPPRSSHLNIPAGLPTWGGKGYKVRLSCAQCNRWQVCSTHPHSPPFTSQTRPIG